MNKKFNSILYIPFFLLGIYISFFQSIIDQISSYYKINNTNAGIIISLHFIGTLLSSWIFGEISSRIGKKKVIESGFIMFFSGLVLIFLSKTIIIAAIGVFIIGGGFGIIEGMTSGVLADKNPDESNKVINISQMFFSIGAVVGPILTYQLLKNFIGWKYIYLILFICFMAAFFLFTKLDITENQVNKKGEILSVVLMKNKIFIHLCICIALFIGIEEGTAFWINTYFKSLNTESSVGFYVLSSYWAGMIIGRYIVSKFNKKLKLILQTGIISSMIFIMISVLSTSTAAKCIGFTLSSFCSSGVWPLLMALTSINFREYTGTAFGIMLSFSAFGGIIFPFLFGLISDYSSMQTSLYILPILFIALLIFQFRIPEAGREISQNACEI
jgi:fucose permease